MATFEFGRFRLDASERVLLRDGEPVALTPKAVDTLILLVQRSGHIVDKAELMTTVWPDTFVGEDSLTRNVSVLRKVLGDGDEFIETVARRGYRFKAAVTERADPGAATLIARRTRVRVVTEEEMPDGEEGSGRGARSIAVLPFTTLDADDSEPYLGPGLADALITKLTSIRRIAVRPTSAILKFAGTGADPIAAGRQLGVESVLSGTIQRSGDRIRVTTQLVSVEGQRAFWGETFDERFTDIFALEDSISAKVMAALMLTVTGEEQRLLTKHHTTNPEAYRWLLRGRYFWSKGAGDWFAKAFESFQQAVAADPNDAVAHAALADCFNVMGFWGNMPATQAFPSAEAAAATALALDPALAEAHAALGWAIVHYRYDRPAAARSFTTSLELSPTAPVALLWWALFLGQVARFEEAIAVVKQAYAQDPLNLHVNYNLGVLLMLSRRDDEAIAQFEKTIELDPAYYMAFSHLALTRALKGQREAALAAQEHVKRMALDTLPWTGAALLAAMLGDRDAALEKLAESVEAAKSRHVFPSMWAQIHAALGDADTATAWLERAFEEHDPWLVWMKVNPCFDRIRSDARFVNLLGRVGLTP